MSPAHSATMRYGISSRRSTASACPVSSSSAAYESCGRTTCTSSTLSNWWLRIMPRVLAGCARLGTETRRVRHPFQRQTLGGHDLLAHQVGERHLGGRNEVERRLAAYREQILLELRQLPGADERLGLHQVRNLHLGVAMLARVQVQHELRQRAVQARELRAHHDEAAACDARRGLEIQPRKPLTELHVIARLERELARLAPAAHLEVGALVAPVGDRGVQQI